MIAHAKSQVGASAVVNAVIEVYFTHEGERFVGTVVEAGVHEYAFVVGIAVASLITAVEVNIAAFFALARKTGENFPGVVGVGIADIDWSGNVHPDQFWQDKTFGNVRQRPFSEIWQDTSDPLMAGLKDRLPLLKGKCATCRFRNMCGGSLRVRAFRVYDDPWMPDPACYLSDAEISS